MEANSENIYNSEGGNEVPEIYKGIIIKDDGFLYLDPSKNADLRIYLSKKRTKQKSFNFELAK